MKKCMACGSDQLADGEVISTGMHVFAYGYPVTFKPEGSKSYLAIFGVACTNCGHIEMAVDKEALRKKIQQ